MPKKPVDLQKYDELTSGGITLRAYHGFDEDTRRLLPEICEAIASRKKELLGILKWIDKVERKGKSWLEVQISLSDPERDRETFLAKHEAADLSMYSLFVSFCDRRSQRKNIFESYEISLGKEIERTAIYVYPRFLDQVFTR